MKWPDSWNAGTFRGVVAAVGSAVLLPIALFIVTRMIATSFSL